MDDPPRAFYDALAPAYHRLFADWADSARRQAAVLDRLIGDLLGPGPHALLDAAAGIGTQAIGLAALGHRVHATDLSPAAIARLRREAAAAGVALTTDIADLRSLATRVGDRFDAVLACDNALPHLLTDADLGLAVANMAATLRPGGLLLASLRDYDRLRLHPPRAEGPRVFDDPDGRRIAFQVWDWTPDRRGYRLHQFLVVQDGAAWRADHFVVEYRALGRADLATALDAAGLVGTRWHEPETVGYHQPIVTARAPAGT